MKLSEINTDLEFESAPKRMRISEALSGEKAEFENRFNLEIRNLTPERKALLRKPTPEEERAMQLSRDIRLIKEFPTDYYSGVPAPLEAFAQGILPIRPVELRRPGVEEAYPIAKAIGEIVGLIGAGKVLAGIAPAITFSQKLAALPTVARFAAGRMAQTGATFGLKEIADNMADAVSGDKKDFQSVVTDTITTTAFGAGLGLTGSIARPVLRIPAEAAYGFTTAKIVGADNFEAGINGGIFAVFGLFNTKNLSLEYKTAAYNGAKRAMVDRLVERGLDPARSAIVSDRYFQFAISRTGGFEKTTIKDFDTFSKAMRKGWKIIVEPEVKPEMGIVPVKPEVRPTPTEGGKIEPPVVVPPIAEPPVVEVAPEELPPEDPIKKLSELLKQAKPLRGKLEAKYTAERAKRISEVERVIDEIGGEKGYAAALSKLKGELVPGAKVVFEPIKEKLAQEDIDMLYNKTFKHPYLDNWEKLSAADGLSRILTGELPQPKQLVFMEEVYGSDLIKALLAKRAMGLKAMDMVIDIANIPRALLASADMSGFLRQGVIYVVAHPGISAKAMGKTFQFAFSQKTFDQYFKDLPSDPLYNLMRKSGLAITDPSRAGLLKREEAFMSRLLTKIPIIGDILRFSERSYVGFLNKLRVDVFRTFTDEFLSKGYSPIKNAELFKSAAEVVNTFTGRGSMGRLNRIGPHLSAIFFSPRLIVARFNTLNPAWYSALPPEMRKKALSDFAKFVAMGLTVMALAKLNEGVDVEIDPRSSDFGKIKVGNTRWDVWAGFQQWVRVFSQLITGQRKSTTTGEIVALSKEEYPFTTRKEVLLRFVEGKFAPVPALINEMVSGGKTFEGADMTPETVIKEKLIPMYIQDIVDSYEEGGFERAVPAGVSAFFGVGVQTYKTKQSKKGKYRRQPL